MRYLAIILLFTGSLVWSCQNDSKSTAVNANPPATNVPQKQEEPLKAPPSGVTLTNEQIEKAFEEKMKELKPNANNATNEPIELKGVNFEPEVNQFMVQKGQKVFDTKCTTCHNLTAKPYKASGLKGITIKRKPVWVMNFITGVPMDRLVTDGKEQATLAQCYTRQEGNRLSIPEARDFLELMRNIDQ
jgi:mono/diheme cytochrome c family protein